MAKFDEAYWQGQLRKALKVRETLWAEGDASVASYTARTKGLPADNKLKDVERKINCWAFIVNTLIPAFYSKPPEIEFALRNERERPEYLLGALIGEKVAAYQLEEENELHQTLYHFVLQYALTGFGCLWARYEVDKTTEELEVRTNVFGQPIYEKVEVLQSERAILESLHFKDYLCSDSRKFDEVTWKARRAFLSKEEALEKGFKEKDLEPINFDLLEETDKLKEETTDTDNQRGDKAAFWEIYCEESLQTYWMAFGGSNDGTLVDTADLPVNLKKVFPCSEILANVNPSDLIPTSTFTLVKDSILEVERLTTRIHACAEAIRVNFAYDSALGTEIQNLFTGDFKGYPVTNKSLTGIEGKIADSIEYLQIGPYVEALKVLVDTREQALQRIYEASGSDDLIRGNTNPQETATAQNLKNDRTSLRFSVPQRDIAAAIERALNIVGEIVAEEFSEETILEISNAENLLLDLPDKAPELGQAPMQPQAQVMPGQGQLPMPMPQQPLPAANSLQNLPIHQREELINKAVAVLKDEYTRRFNIKIKSDSMIALDERDNRAERMELLQAANGSFKELRAMVLEAPEMIDGIKEIFRFTIRSFKGYKEIEPKFMAMFDNVKNKAMQAKGQAQQQMPDPTIVQANAQVEVARTNERVQMAKVNSDLQIATINKEIAQINNAAKMAQTELDKLQAELELEKLRQAPAIKQAELINTNLKIEGGLEKEDKDTEQELIKKGGQVVL